MNPSLKSFYSTLKMIDEYYTLLDRVDTLITKQAHRITPPDIRKTGKRPKISSEWVNFGTICAELGRDPEHVLAFVLDELATTGTLKAAREGGLARTDKHDRLQFAHVFNTLQIESVLLKYIRTYVRCNSCGALDTRLEKDQEKRLFKIACNNCTSERYFRN